MFPFIGDLNGSNEFDKDYDFESIVYEEFLVKQQTKKKKNTMATAPKTIATMDLSSFLPKAATVNTTKPESLVVLTYGKPGVGKTSWACANPDSVLLACEAGHKFISAYKIIIDCWKHKGKAEEPYTDEHGNVHMSFIQAVQVLQETNRFKTVIVDTLDMLVKMCVDYYTDKAGAAHISEMGDFGKGYDLAQNIPVRQAFNDLLKTERGVVFTSHEQETAVNGTKGTKHKKETTLPNGIHKFLYGQCDLILHLTLGGLREGMKNRDRIMVADPSEDAMAKNRGGILPNAWLIEPEPSASWKQYIGFFDAKDGKKNIDKATAELKKHYE